MGDISGKTRLRPRLARAVIILLLTMAASFILSIGIGAVSVSPMLVLKVIANHVHGLGFLPHYHIADETDYVVWQSHLPRAVLGALVGMSLAMAGTGLQALLLNPLADPYMVGVSSGAAVGAGLAVVLGLGVLFTPFCAFASAMLAVGIVYWLAKRAGKVSILSFVLAGVVVGAFMWAALTFIMTVAPNQTLDKIVFWTMGSLTGSDPWSKVVLLLPFTVLGFIALFAFARDLNLFALGEESASYLGIEVESLKRIIIILTTLITAAAVSVSGTIGFVGLMVPHMARRLFGPDNRILIPASALMGAVLMIAADTVARGIMPPTEIPVGVITALLGSPFFLYLLKRSRS